MLNRIIIANLQATSHIQDRWQQYKPKTLIIKTTIFISFFFCLFTVYGQQKFAGKIIGEDLEIIPLVTIYDKDTTVIAKSDLNGYFKFELLKETDELIFAGVGFEWANITIPKNCDYLEVILLLAGTYHYKSNRRIDRIRKKRFDKIPKLHQQAYNKGIFKNDKPCYSREFKPIKPELDKIEKRLKQRAKENKNDFKDLNIGDIVKIPFGIDSSKKRISTTFSPCLNCTEADYDYVIKGEIVNKRRRRLTLKIKITEMPNYDSLEYHGKSLSVGSNFKYEMKYFNVIIGK